MRSGVDHTVLTANTPHLHLPLIHVPNYMDHYPFTDPWEMDGWVGQGMQHAALYKTTLQLGVRNLPKVFARQRLAGNRTAYLWYTSPTPPTCFSIADARKNDLSLITSVAAAAAVIVIAKITLHHTWQVTYGTLKQYHSQLQYGWGRVGGSQLFCAWLGPWGTS